MAQLHISGEVERVLQLDLHMSTPQPRILVVDDEPLLRLVNVDVLSDAGFEVLEAGNADEALRLLSDVKDIRVVFTDVEMPGQIDGFALADRIEALWPDIGVVVTSGRRLPGEGFGAGARCFVPKPYQFSEVVELIGSFANAKKH
jgi:two-component system, response regulator PdtaR